MGTFTAIIFTLTFSVFAHGGDIETVKIGEQMWMKRNLDVVPSGKNNAATNSWCYDNDHANCKKYGRLYDWATAMALSEKCNEEICTSQIQSKHKGLCPEGFHIPSNADWDELMGFVDGNTSTSSPYNSETAGKYLKATSSWNNNGNGTDKYGFAALPSGSRYSDGNFDNVGNFGYWWSSSEFYSNSIYNRLMGYDSEVVYWSNLDKLYGFSVRCVKND